MCSLLYGSTPASFASPYSVQESVERLRATAARPSLFGAFTWERAKGEVSEDCVSLVRVTSSRNAFKPYFVGRFERTDAGKTVLAGSFSMSGTTKAFMTFWFGFCVLWTGLATIYLVTGIAPADRWYFPVFGIGMMLLGAGIVKLGKSSASRDVAWLSRLITTALAGPTAA